MPVSFAIWDANGKRTEKVTIDSLEQSFTFAYTGELKNVLFDENQVLLGKYYEDKPTAQFVHQFYNSNRYKARYTSIKRLSRTKSDVVDKLLYDAMNDPFWHIRLTAVEHYSKSKTALVEKVLLKVKEIAQNDAKSQTRAESINCLTSLSSEEATIFFKDVIAKEKSFLVISTALQVLSDINPKEALDYARGMEKENVKSMNVTVGEIYSQQGEAQDNEFLIDC
ncbi:MAG: HEAT repeat domain-containing protein [Flavobacteriales bacterium]|nr:HEAT repeat domain-containing protein [Flavobacteriales bacterium]